MEFEKSRRNFIRQKHLYEGHHESWLSEQVYKALLTILVGGFNHPEKISQIGNLPQIGVKIKQYLKPPPSIKMSTGITLDLPSDFTLGEKNK